MEPPERLHSTVTLVFETVENAAERSTGRVELTVGPVEDQDLSSPMGGPELARRAPADSPAAAIGRRRVANHPEVTEVGDDPDLPAARNFHSDQPFRDDQAGRSEVDSHFVHLLPGGSCTNPERGENGFCDGTFSSPWDRRPEAAVR